MAFFEYNIQPIPCITLKSSLKAVQHPVQYTYLVEKAFSYFGGSLGAKKGPKIVKKWFKIDYSRFRTVYFYLNYDTLQNNFESDEHYQDISTHTSIYLDMLYTKGFGPKKRQ